MAKLPILLRVEHQDADLRRLGELFEVHYAPTVEAFAKVVGDLGPTIRGVITNGSFGISGEHVRAMPKLEIVLARGVGFEKVDIGAAKERGVIVTNGQGLNSPAVADHAMALMLALVRRIPSDDRAIRDGKWQQAMRPVVHGKRMGILGLGGVGSAIARRAASFDMTVAYHSRNRKPGVAFEFFEDAVSLAKASDVLMIALPGGEQTRAAVNADVLKALGPSGYLVNVGRGSVVDTNAMIAALKEGTIAGAATDVIEGEPVMPEGLLEAPNFIITPHTGGLAPEIMALANNQVFANLKAHFSGQPITNRIV
jgi:lactate dehydrogenase-like 2-hydroxyacid dehydrogenase